ncbi:NnrS family protein [Neptuniibacter halophilus]|uniref:NnrS family protein n=1 Tax=Neptuniibacter halophilus TaxID=651666 RepID=UPI002574239F|nr:NnrS family protein [Neptuniibacter halophilus]
MIQLQERKSPPPFSLFNLGFRPFFLGSAIAAAVLIGCWLVFYSSGYQPHYYRYAVYWHAHEMLFGYTLAVIAGFLLTAVRNWTQVQTLHGWPLGALFLLWLSARLLPFFPAVSIEWVALIDLSFLPLLTLSLAWPILRSRNYRNLVFVVIMLGFFAANLMIHLQLLGITGQSADSGIQLALFLVVVVISILGGRVIPFFTERGVTGVRCRKFSLLEKAIIPLTLSWALISLSPYKDLIAALSLLLAAVHLLRLAGWFDLRIFSTPLVWILQLGYLFIGVGFALYGLSEWALVSRSIGFHAFAAGGIGCLTLGMMARVSLGHTGRSLVIGPMVVSAFILLLLSALLRISISLLPLPYLATLHLSGSLWILAWLLFLLHYTPILIRPRTDGVYG